ncbi:DMT family transporter [Rubripirellula amarantea]|uniref:EamA-like transporter family protein n=1 Tax=Rubripirellula amarantea TaxID=2527999 RepID=A0A5C5WWT4_9BACT|nr:DMT family transporter [Rubripirellula amarantea]MDA8743730.1 DMT family transporter [Rubripirellula amarantea]TWT54601.1 EamA-like transporter family protein [Rubripirellula amarantea]
MNWLLLSVVSAFLLGLYDAAKKTSVRGNAVPPVLFWAVTCGASIWIPLLIAGRIFPSEFAAWNLYVTPISGSMHLAILLKSTIVSISWTLAYFALKRLPLSIASPLRAIGPVWTILIATLWLGERPTYLQWIGIAIVVVSFFALSSVGKKEGIYFRRNPAVGWMILATIVGACSGLYDKILLQRFHLDAATVQAWFSIYLVVVLLPLVVYWRVYDSVKTPFQWRRSIPFIAILLLAADFAYFTALSDPDALVSVVSPVRRSATVVSFALGVIYFGEKNVGAKAVCIAILLLGVFTLSFG